MRTLFFLMLSISCVFSTQAQSPQKAHIPKLQLGAVQTNIGMSFDVYASYQQQQMLNQVVSPERINYDLNADNVTFYGHNPVESTSLGIAVSFHPVDAVTGGLNLRKEFRFSLNVNDREGLITYYEQINTADGPLNNEFTYCILQTEATAGFAYLFHNAPEKWLDAYIGFGGQLGATVVNDMLMMLNTQNIENGAVVNQHDEFWVDGNFNLYQRFTGIAGIVIPFAKLGTVHPGLNLEVQSGSGVNWVSGGTANWLPLTGSVMMGVKVSFL